MSGIRRVVVATDFSAGSVQAVDRGVLLAQAHGACLEVLHAFDPSAWRALQGIFDARRLTGEVPNGVVAREQLSALAESLAAKTGLDVTAHNGVGDAAAAIASHVKTMKSALVVIARRADPGAPGLGSTLMRVLRSAPCPVLVVRNGVARDYERVLSAVDLRDVSWRAASAALEWLPGAEHELLSVIDPAWERELMRHPAAPVPGPGGDEAESLHARAERQLQRLAHDLCLRPGCRVRSEVIEGVPVRAIVDRAAAWPADCVAVGRHGQGALADRFLGSTSLDLLHHAVADVLVVP
jgi:nucleotide-binding universal stress UspA family protein